MAYALKGYFCCNDMVAMKANKLILIFLSGFFSISLSAQETGNNGYYDIDPMPLLLKARLIGMGDEQPIAYAHVINPRTHGGTTSNFEGYFTMDMLNIDSLKISAIGFLDQTVGIPVTHHPDSILDIYIQPAVFSIREVTVEGEKQKVNLGGDQYGKPIDISPELRGDAFNEKPPVVAALFNPISYWQYYLSKKERRKRDVRQAIALEKNWEMHSENYNKEKVMLLTGLDDEQADEFMIWFNSKNVLAYTSSEYEVRAAIREYFEIYRKEGRLR